MRKAHEKKDPGIPAPPFARSVGLPAQRDKEVDHVNAVALTRTPSLSCAGPFRPQGQAG